MTRPTAVIVDVDMTLSRGSKPIVEGRGFKFVEQARADGHEILVVTARPAALREPTEAFLRAHVGTYASLSMKANDDTRPDVAYKLAVWRRLSRAYRVVGAIDDQPSVLALWRQLRIPNVEAAV